MLGSAAREVQELFLYWADCRAGRPLPRRVDIDMAEVGEAFPHVLLAESQPASQHATGGAFIYRPRGESGIALDPALFRHIPLYACVDAIAQGAPLIERIALLSTDGAEAHYQVVFLPLTDDAGNGAVSALILAVEVAVTEGDA